ncbi:MAG: hypothetical protein IID44_22610 [Planctomycetes bacterium]|nr:hypothetical protein [Planctomycetota bacterium]
METATETEKARNPKSLLDSATLLDARLSAVLRHYDKSEAIVHPWSQAIPSSASEFRSRKPVQFVDAQLLICEICVICGQPVKLTTT